MRVCVCSAAALSIVLVCSQCYELAGLAVWDMGQRGFFEASQTLVFIFLPGDPCTLARVCASSSSISTHPAWLQWSWFAGSLALILSSFAYEGILHLWPAPMVVVHTLLQSAAVIAWS